MAISRFEAQVGEYQMSVRWWDAKNKEYSMTKTPGHSSTNNWYNGQPNQQIDCFGPHCCLPLACPVSREKDKYDKKPRDELDVQGEEAKRPHHHHGGNAKTKHVSKTPKASRAKPKSANKAIKRNY